jgi:hypothetical protein
MPPKAASGMIASLDQSHACPRPSAENCLLKMDLFVVVIGRRLRSSGQAMGCTRAAPEVDGKT